MKGDWDGSRDKGSETHGYGRIGTYTDRCTWMCAYRQSEQRWARTREGNGRVRATREIWKCYSAELKTRKRRKYILKARRRKTNLVDISLQFPFSLLARNITQTFLREPGCISIVYDE